MEASQSACSLAGWGEREALPADGPAQIAMALAESGRGAARPACPSPGEDSGGWGSSSPCSTTHSDSTEEGSPLSLLGVGDEELVTAAAQAMEKKSLIPLLKQELWCKIQTRRLSQGKGELVLAAQRPQPDELTQREVDRKKKRREQNRQAAKKFRMKEKARTETLRQKVEALQASNRTLCSRLEALGRERDELAHVLQRHLENCVFLECGLDKIGAEFSLLDKGIPPDWLDAYLQQ